MSMKNSTDPPISKQSRLSDMYAVVLTVEPLCRQSSRPSVLRIKGGIGLWSRLKFCIFDLPQSTGMVPSNVTCSLFVAHISGPWLAGCIC